VDLVSRRPRGELRLREISVARLESFFNELEDRDLSPNHRRSLRAAVSGIFQVAGQTPSHRLQSRERPRRHRRRPQAGVRIGEALAVRWCDLQLDGIPVPAEGKKVMVPVVAVTHTITRPPGKTLQRTTVKTEAGKRLLPLPAFVVAMLRTRRTEIFADEDPVFPAAGRSGLTWREPSEVGRWIKEAREDDAVQLEWMTSHSWRKTYLTVLDDEREMTDRAKADLAGQSRFLVLSSHAVSG
jgi:integrase